MTLAVFGQENVVLKVKVRGSMKKYVAQDDKILAKREKCVNCKRKKEKKSLFSYLSTMPRNISFSMVNLK